jgi:hypothetical protein
VIAVFEFRRTDRRLRHTNTLVPTRASVSLDDPATPPGHALGHEPSERVDQHRRSGDDELGSRQPSSGQDVKGVPGRHRVSSHGPSPATVPGATAKKTVLPTAAAILRTSPL